MCVLVKGLELKRPDFHQLTEEGKRGRQSGRKRESYSSSRYDRVQAAAGNLNSFIHSGQGT